MNKCTLVLSWAFEYNVSWAMEYSACICSPCYCSECNHHQGEWKRSTIPSLHVTNLIHCRQGWCLARRLLYIIESLIYFCFFKVSFLIHNVPAVSHHCKGFFMNREQSKNKYKLLRFGASKASWLLYLLLHLGVEHFLGTRQSWSSTKVCGSKARVIFGGTFMHPHNNPFPINWEG